MDTGDLGARYIDGRPIPVGDVCANIIYTLRTRHDGRHITDILKWQHFLE